MLARRLDGRDLASHTVFATQEIVFAFTRGGRHLIQATWIDSVPWSDDAVRVRLPHGVYVTGLRSLKQLQSQLPRCFVPVNRSLVVNLNAVHHIEKREKPPQLVFLAQGAHAVPWGERVFLPRRRSKGIEAFLDSIREACPIRSVCCEGAARCRESL